VRIKRADLFPNIDFMQREMERLFNDMWGRRGMGLLCSQETWRPATDVYETPNELVVKLELPGMRDRQVEVMLEDRTLLVSGYRGDDRPVDSLSYYEMGINYGRFCVQIFLPWPVQQDAVNASYEDGFLRIRLPRRVSESEPSRQVRIQIGGK
jgi:HSP20 family protein